MALKTYEVHVSRKMKDIPRNRLVKMTLVIRASDLLDVQRRMIDILAVLELDPRQWQHTAYRL